MLKRGIDIVLSVIATLFLWPLAAVVAGAIALLDGRPILFRHKRVGHHGKDFELLKFRTMRVEPCVGEGAFDCGNQDRVTRVGRFLRYWKLDELPQFWNVIKGDMSLVGPRPEVRKWVTEYEARWEKVHKVRPGITDPASIVFRHEEHALAESTEPELLYRHIILPQKLALYEEYIDAGEDAWRDLVILLKTVSAILTKRKSHN